MKSSAKNITTPAGFEPALPKGNRFLIYRRNHLAMMSSTSKESVHIYYHFWLLGMLISSRMFFTRLLAELGESSFTYVTRIISYFLLFYRRDRAEYFS